jgi:hypothetical protein
VTIITDFPFFVVPRSIDVLDLAFARFTAFTATPSEPRLSPAHSVSLTTHYGLGQAMGSVTSLDEAQLAPKTLALPNKASAEPNADATIQAPLPNPSLQVTADHQLKAIDAPVYAPKAGEVLLHIKCTGVCG